MTMANRDISIAAAWEWKRRELFGTLYQILMHLLERVVGVATVATYCRAKSRPFVYQLELRNATRDYKNNQI
jgi:hypothetical protein